MPGFVTRNRMNNEDELALTESLEKIVNILEPLDVIPALISKKIISRTDRDTIQKQNTREEKAMKLIDILIMRDCNTLKRFIMVLRENDYQPLATYISERQHGNKHRTCQDEQFMPHGHQKKSELHQRGTNETKTKKVKEVKQIPVHPKDDGEYRRQEKDKLLGELSSLFDDLDRKFETSVSENSVLKEKLTKLRAEFEAERKRNEEFCNFVQNKREERQICEEYFWKLFQDKREETKKFEGKMIIALDTLVKG